MFKKNANTMFNNAAFKCAMIPAMAKREKKERGPMHEQMVRLYKAAEELRSITGQSAVARLLNESPQNIRHWEDRGVSFKGMVDAQEIIGCSAVWIRNGIGPMVIGELYVAANDGVDGGLGDALKLTAETSRELRMLSVYRLSGKDGRLLIDSAVDSAGKDINLSGAFHERE